MSVRWAERALVLLAALATAAGCPRDGATGTAPVRFDDASLRAGRSALGMTVVEVVPPIAPPHGERMRTRVIVGLPDGAVVSAVTDSDGIPSLQLPAGALVARVEEVARGGRFLIADVRGSFIDAVGERFFVARPDAPGSGAPLTGLSWSRDDAAAEHAAHEQLGRQMIDENWGFVSPPQDRQAAAQKFQALGRCAACHERRKPAFYSEADKGQRQGFFPNRATDAHGYYALASAFADAEPRESYRPIDDNAGPFFRVAPAPGGASDRAGDVPQVAFDTAAAFAAGDLHALDVCASRAALFDRMDATARAAFAAPMTACGLSAQAALRDGRRAGAINHEVP